ncbi:CHAT domain-containing protein [Cellulomonas biazotea]|uniref:CHAT domain-containing protein n=1 Tax=Cellulomonas biazotea TaxID=1709 RepID=A0A402DQM1_9CELL|nr:CHAT domain-containing protein [Cellulomonas biazotea]GCE76391.1 hypothetical protein CBZ_14470 [Cellulomonas biazotea]
MTTSLEIPPAGVPSGTADVPVLDLDVLVVPDGTGYRTRVSLRTPRGEQTANRAFVPPLTPEVLAAFADELDAARQQTRPGPRPALAARTEALGRALFDALFATDARDLLVTARNLAAERGGALRVRLQLDQAPEVAALPWELLLHGSNFLVHTAGVYVVRYADATEPVGPAPLGDRLRILVVAASPTDRTPLDVDREYAALQDAVAPLGDAVHLHRLEQPTLDGLQAALKKEQWHVLHFVGHGGAGAQGGVVTLEWADRTAHVVDADTFANHLVAAPWLRVAVLNGCSTGEVTTQEPQSGTAHALVRAGVPVAVAMQYPVTDHAAHRVAAALYESLAAGSSVEQAVSAARHVLIAGPEWVTPVLYTRTSPQVFATPPPPPVPVVPPRDRVPEGVVPPPDLLQPRWWAVREVAAWTDGPSSLLLLTGVTGAGTSVLAGWLAGAGTGFAGPDAPAEAALLEDVRSRWSAVHVVRESGSGASVDPRAVVSSLAEQLAVTVPGWQPPRADAAGPYGLAHLPVADLSEVLLGRPWRAVLADAPGTTVRVLVDGVDAGGIEPVLTLAGLPGVRVLVATSDPAVAAAAQHHDAARLDLGTDARRVLVDADLQAYLRRRLAPAGRGDDVVDALVERVDGSFLLARNAAEQLLAHPDLALDALVLPAQAEASSGVALRTILEQAYGDTLTEQWATAVEPVLGHLAVARGPVPLPALVRWLDSTLPRVAATVGSLAGLVVADGDGCRLAHSTLGATLRAPQTEANNLNLHRVDAPAAHERVVAATVALTPEDLARPDDVGASYGLVHAPGHLAELPPDPRLLAELTERALQPDWVAALVASVHDPLLVGRPYRDLVALHLGGADGRDAVERVVRFLGSSDVPLLRGAVFDVLAAYVEKDATAATTFLVRLAVGDSPELQRIALHATCLLPAAAQADAFIGVVTHPAATDAHADAAAFALYSNGTADPLRLIEDVLTRIAAGVRLVPPTPRTRRIFDFFSQVTVTNYVNDCADDEVVRVTSGLWHGMLVDRIGVTRPVWGPLVQRLVVRGYVATKVSRRVLRLFTPPGDPDGPVELGGGLPEAPSARRAVAALDPATDLGPLVDDLRALLRSDTTMFRVLAALVVATHDVQDPEGADALADRLLVDADARTRRALLVAHSVVAPGPPAGWLPLLQRLTATVTAVEHDDHPAAGPLGGRHLVFVPLALACASTGTPMDVLDPWLRPDADEGWRYCCLRGLGAVGLYHPDPVLTTLERLDREDVLPLADAVPALSLMAGLHPMRTRTWLLRAGRRDVLDDVFGRADPPESREHLELLGMYNAAVHACVTSPRVRERVVAGTFAAFLDSRTQGAWSRRFSGAGVRLLREGGWQIRTWNA